MRINERVIERIIFQDEIKTFETAGEDTENINTI